MAGQFSGHLVDSFLSAQLPARGPFGQPIPDSTSIAIHGPMSFLPQMHGHSISQPTFKQEPSFMDLSEETAKRIATLQAKLNKKLGPEFISQRPGPGGGPKLTYAEGWKIINLANEVFGFNGWSSSVVNLMTDFIDHNEETKRFSIGVTAVVRVTLRDGVFHEDVGYGLLENSKSKGAALDKCKKEAVTDAVKRTLRNFGNLLGNCLYDKSYTQEVIKIKVPPPKFDKSELHRRPEFNDSREGESTSIPSKAPASGPSVKPESSSRLNNILSVINSPTPQPQVLSAVPPRMRSTSGPEPAPVAVSTPTAKGKAPMGAMGLNTPVHTPAGPLGGRTVVGQHAQAPQQEANQTASTSKQPSQENRRVSFASPPAVGTSASAASASTSISRPPVAPPAEDIPEEDDVFHFNSEDDAFLAEVDLGEDGIGRPIDFDEGTGGVVLSAGSKEPDQQQQQQQHPLQPHSRAVQQQLPPQQQSRAVQQQPQPQMQRVSHTVSNAVHRQQASTSHANQNLPPKPAQPGPSGVTSTSGGHSVSRSVTPSNGGFHFPPGVNPQSLQPGNALPARQAGVSGNGMGLKRSADAMQGHSTAASRRPAQGMGLAPHSGGGFSGHAPSGGQKREPFAALELGEGGDVKRVRR